MTKQTAPFFIFSSGRSGTKMMEKLLSSYAEVEMHHEYMVHYIQPTAVKYQLGLIDNISVIDTLQQTHQAAITYSQSALWGDSSNKLCWIIGALNEIFPSARFIHLVRDGRKVASSYLHKLGNECYDDASVIDLNTYLQAPLQRLAPPPEKRFWWPQPKFGTPDAATFQSYSQFERIAWHWAAAHSEVAHQLQKIPAERQHFLRLEDLTTVPHEIDLLTDFLGLERSKDGFKMLATPHNVNQPINFPLTEIQRAQFDTIAGPTMRSMGYVDQPEYAVNY